MVKIKYILAFTLLLTAFQAYAEVNHYIVFFKDKSGTPYTIDQPSAFLSQRAVNRRLKQNIFITEQDLPVNPAYINQLKDLGFKVLFSTKWLNGALVDADDQDLPIIQGLEFVKDIQLASPLKSGARSGRKKGVKNYTGMAEKTWESTATLATATQNNMLGVDMMHEEGYTGQGMMIGIFDSGFSGVDQSAYFTDIFQNNQIVATRDFVYHSKNVFQFDTHGSKVFSCIAGYKPAGFEGTAFDANFVLCVTENISSEFRVEEYNWLFAAEYADSLGVDVINSSVGYSYFDDPKMDYTYDQMDGKTAIITRAARIAANKGMIVVVSNGNEGNNSWKYLNAPADADSIISVGAVNSDAMHANFSSYGPTSDGRIKPDLSAMGVWTSVVNQDMVSISNGTSFSTPLITGLVAGFWQAFPDLTGQEVIQYLKLTASQSDMPDTLLGWGIPNFQRAFNKVKINEGDIQSRFVIFPNPVDDRRIIYIYDDNFFIKGDNVLIDFFDIKGSHLNSTDIQIKDSGNPVELDISYLKPGTYILVCQSQEQTRKAKLIVL